MQDVVGSMAEGTMRLQARENSISIRIAGLLDDMVGANFEGLNTC